MVLADFDDDCVQRNRICQKTCKACDMTAEEPFRVFDDYYPRYTNPCCGPVFSIAVIFGTVVQGLAYIIMIYQSSSYLVDTTDVPIPTSQEFYLDTSIGVQIYNSSGDAVFTSDNSWQQKLAAQWVQCEITDANYTCTTLGGGYTVNTNGIAPDVSSESSLGMKNQLYGYPYTVIGLLLGHCSTGSIPLPGASSGFSPTATNCAFDITTVQAELNNAVVVARGDMYLPSSISQSFLKDSTGSVSHRMDASGFSMVDYQCRAYSAEPLTISLLGATLSSEGFAAKLDTASVMRYPSTASGNSVSIFGSNANYSAVTLNATSMFGFYQFGLKPVMRKSLVDNAIRVNTVALFGSWLALCGLITFFFTRVNMICFWKTGNKDASAKRMQLRVDSSTQKKLEGIIKRKPSELENELLYSLTIGGTKKFGFQTKHLFNYYQSDEHDPDQLFRVQEPIRKYETSHKIVQSLTRAKNPRVDKVVRDRLNQEARQALEKETSRSRKEIFVGMALYHLTAQIGAIKASIASQLPKEAKEYELEARLKKIQ